MEIEKLLNFTCPRWEQLPEKPIFNRQAVDFINDKLSPILDDDARLTTTMVQNYVKWGLIPKEPGRKYSRDRIAYLIVISIYKQAINLSNVKKGVDLLLKHYPIDQAYDVFASTVESAIRDVFSQLGDKKLATEKKFLALEEIGLYAVANSFAYKLLGNIIIDSDGYKNLGV